MIQPPFSSIIIITFHYFNCNSSFGYIARVIALIQLAIAS